MESSRLLVTRIIEAQEGERRQLARQMHDGPAQSLTNLILQAEICERLFDTDPDRAKAELTNLKNAVNTTFQKVRDFIFDLRPMMLDDLGLAPTVKRYIDAYQGKVDYRITLHVTGEERRLPAPVEITLFRALQELLQNVTSHANAHQVTVQLNFQDGEVVLTVEDDGVGFDTVEALQPAQRGQAVGLKAMQERIEMLGGHLQVDSSIGHGTRVYIRVPATEPVVA
ncbi:MAG: sensor histidine kinase [Ardenticatenia bacterium]|nr:sensor histidine kinase [Ardenticatenia bacterium]